FLFSFYCYRDSLHLHSFPTRRSSDLAADPLRLGWVGDVEDLQALIVIRHISVVSRDCYCQGKAAGIKASDQHWTGWVADVKHVRSEEHTSELQSRFDLVCRLLLEKKK